MVRFIPNSYYERDQTISVYAQRLWWCYSVDSSDMVDATHDIVLNDVFSPQPTAVVAYNIKDKKFGETKYVTVIKRFHKSVSALQVHDDWLCKHYPTRRYGFDIFNIWHPSRSEIVRCAINDTFVDSFEVQREKLWSFEQGEYRYYSH